MASDPKNYSKGKHDRGFGGKPVPSVQKSLRTEFTEKRQIGKKRKDIQPQPNPRNSNAGTELMNKVHSTYGVPVLEKRG